MPTKFDLYFFLVKVHANDRLCSGWREIQATLILLSANKQLKVEFNLGSLCSLILQANPDILVWGRV